MGADVAVGNDIGNEFVDFLVHALRKNRVGLGLVVAVLELDVRSSGAGDFAAAAGGFSLQGFFELAEDLGAFDGSEMLVGGVAVDEGAHVGRTGNAAVHDACGKLPAHAAVDILNLGLGHLKAGLEHGAEQFIVTLFGGGELRLYLAGLLAHGPDVVQLEVAVAMESFGFFPQRIEVVQHIGIRGGKAGVDPGFVLAEYGFGHKALFKEFGMLHDVEFQLVQEILGVADLFLMAILEFHGILAIGAAQGDLFADHLEFLGFEAGVIHSIMERFVEGFRTLRERLQRAGVTVVLDGMGDGVDAQSEYAEQDTLGRGGRALLVGVFK